MRKALPITPSSTRAPWWRVRDTFTNGVDFGITMVAAPGVPGGAIVTAAGLLSSMLGFTEPQVGLMIATYIAIDSFGTATNVTGDGSIAAVMHRLITGKRYARAESDTAASARA